MLALAGYKQGLVAVKPQALPLHRNLHPRCKACYPIAEGNERTPPV